MRVWVVWHIRATNSQTNDPRMLKQQNNHWNSHVNFFFVQNRWLFCTKINRKSFKSNKKLHIKIFVTRIDVRYTKYWQISMGFFYVFNSLLYSKYLNIAVLKIHVRSSVLLVYVYVGTFISLTCRCLTSPYRLYVNLLLSFTIETCTS